MSPYAAESLSSIVFDSPRQISMISSSEDRIVGDHVTQGHILHDHITQDCISQDCIARGREVQDRLAQNLLDWYRGVVHPIVCLTPVLKIVLSRIVISGPSHLTHFTTKRR